MTMTTFLQAVPVLASAFFGAFFAFLFTRLGQWLAGRHKRGKIHRDALARLERLCVDYLNDIITNRNLTNRAVEALSAGVPYWQFPHAFPIRRSFAVEIFDLDLAIRVTEVNTMLRRFNRNVADFRRAHDDLQKAMLAQTLDASVWAATTQKSAPLWQQFARFYDDLDSHVRDVAVRSILMWQQHQSRRSRLLRGLGILRCWPLDKAKVATAREEFDRTREESLAKTRKRLDDLLHGKAAGPTA